MYCPNCASSIDNVKYCRTCGANVSLVPQALTGRISDPERDQTLDPARRRKSQAMLESAVKSGFTGLAFLFIAGAVWRFAPAGGIWWFWMLLPAFAMIGEAIAKYMRWRSERGQEVMPLAVPSRNQLSRSKLPRRQVWKNPHNPRVSLNTRHII